MKSYFTFTVVGYMGSPLWICNNCSTEIVSWQTCVPPHPLKCNTSYLPWLRVFSVIINIATSILINTYVAACILIATLKKSFFLSRNENTCCSYFYFILHHRCTRYHACFKDLVGALALYSSLTHVVCMGSPYRFTHTHNMCLTGILVAWSSTPTSSIKMRHGYL